MLNQAKLKAILNELFTSPISFRKALGLSVLLHLLFLGLAAVVFSFIHIAEMYTPPLVFDFVFMPAKDYEESKVDMEKHKTPENTKKIQKSKQQIRPNSQINLDTIKKSTTSKQPTFEPFENTNPELFKENHKSVEEAVKSSITSETTDLKTIKGPYFVTTVAPSPLKLNRLKVHRDDIIPAEISMTFKEKKELYKKAKKLAENLYKLDRRDTTLVWKIKKQIYRARVIHQPARSNMDVDEVVVKVLTEKEGYTLSTEMKMRRLAFCNFAQFVDYWDPHVAIHDDKLVGRFHSNTVFNLSGQGGIQPKFYGKVTTAGYQIRSIDPLAFFDRKKVFLAGIEMGVKEILLPKSAQPFSSDSTLTEDQVQIFEEETWINFQRDGTFVWKTKSESDWNTKRLPQKPFFILGDKKSTLHVKGVVRGKILVYSAKKIIIDNDLTYARHPESLNGSDDYLGLVCDKDIEIGHPSVTGPGDLYIYAAIYAKRRFRVTHLYGNGHAKLFIYGSLTAGTLSATEPRYATHVQFDKRLKSRRPPAFPMTNRYEIIDWDKNWHIARPQNKTLH